MRVCGLGRGGVSCGLELGMGSPEHVVGGCFCLVETSWWFRIGEGEMVYKLYLN